MEKPEKPGNLFLRECTFVAGAANLEALPPVTLPEIAFCGRSNVGKSSLINALTGRNSLCRTSKAPGHTRQLNFFDVAGRLLLVDMPGYGYARASKKMVKGWNRLITDYLAGRPSLKRVMLLIDSRRGIGENDREIMGLLDDLAVSYQVILTKTDEIKASELENLLVETGYTFKKHPAVHPVIIPTSSEKKLGIEELREEMALFAA